MDLAVEFVVESVTDFAKDLAMLGFEHIELDDEYDICRRFYIEKESRGEDN